MPPKKTPVKKPKKKPRQKQKQSQYQQQTVIIHNHPKKTKTKRSTNVSRPPAYSPAVTNVVAYPQNHSYLREQIKQDVEGIISENARQNALVNNLTKDLEMNQARLAFLDTKSVDNIPTSTVRRELIPSTPEKDSEPPRELSSIEKLIDQYKTKNDEQRVKKYNQDQLVKIAEELNINVFENNRKIYTKKELVSKINRKL